MISLYSFQENLGRLVFKLRSFIISSGTPSTQKIHLLKIPDGLETTVIENPFL